MTDWQPIALFGVGAALAVALAGWRHAVSSRRAHELRAARQEAILDAAPLGLLRKTSGGWEPSSIAREMLSASTASSFDMETIARLFTPEAAPRIAEALKDLSNDGARFEITAETVNENRVLHLAGTHHDGVDVIWIRDESAAAWLAEQYSEKEAEVSRLHGYLDALPIPVWWRDQAGAPIVGGNAVHRARFGGDTLREVADSGASERARSLAQLARRTGMPQTESRHLVIDGARRTLDVTETPVGEAGGPVVGAAIDVTGLEDLQVTLAEHVAAQDQVLERLYSAIAIYGPDRRLKFFNETFTKMFHLDPDVLEDQPSMGTLLEILREGRQVPETSDFPAYKRDREALFTSLIDPLQELLHLPDGRTIRGIVAPHPLGGLVFQYEDVTDRLALESSYNTMTAVQRSTLNAMFEGVAVFGRDGRLKLYNDTFRGLFGFEDEWLAREPHVAEMAEAGREHMTTTRDWEETKRVLVNKVSEPKPESGRMTLGDGRVLDYAYVPLPDGQCLVLYFDVTDSTQVEAALRERNRALENADLLKSRFLSSVSYEFRTPLNAIAGFAELLRLEAFGPLSERQAEYVTGILGASETLSDLVTNILDLAAAQAGFIELDRQVIDLTDCLAGAAADMDPARITLEPSEAAVTALVDADRLSQAFRKLLGDADRYAAPDASIRISVASHGAHGARVALVVPAPAYQDDDAWPRRVLGVGDRPDGDPTPTEHDIELSLARSLLQVQGFKMSIGENGTALCCDVARE